MLARYHRRQTRLYQLLHAPLPLVYNKMEQMLPSCEGVKLFVGGAGNVIPPGFLNIDSAISPGVDVSADLQVLPFCDNSVTAIECDAVLEHVRDPRAAIAEMTRVLRPGGFLHVVVPFCHPFHAYPSDYQRWTTEGLRELFSPAHWNILGEGIRTGPTATMLAFLCEYCRILAPGRLGKIAYAIANWLV